MESGRRSPDPSDQPTNGLENAPSSSTVATNLSLPTDTATTSALPPTPTAIQAAPALIHYANIFVWGQTITLKAILTALNEKFGQQALEGVESNNRWYKVGFVTLENRELFVSSPLVIGNTSLPTYPFPRPPTSETPSFECRNGCPS